MKMRHVLGAVCAATAVVLGLAMPAVPAPRKTATRCEPAAFDEPTFTIRSTVCRPTHGAPRATVVLVHGSTYDRHYWDPRDLDPERYSALRLLAARGYQVVAIDRLGSGASTRLSDEAQTADASASAIHAVIQQLRRTQTWQTSSGKVFVVGHSSGSSLAIRECATYHDCDGLVITGLLHTPGIGADLFLPMLHPAKEDPKFKDDPSIPAGYVTTIPGESHGVRVLWYDVYGGNVDPTVIAYDERVLKDAMPGVDSGGFVDEVFSGQPRSREIDQPVLVIIGEHDYSHCDPPDCRPNARAEIDFWPKVPEFQLELVPNAGHVLNLHENAAKTTGRIGRWLDRQLQA